MINTAVAPFDRLKLAVHPRNARFGINTAEGRVLSSELRLKL